MYPRDYIRLTVQEWPKVYVCLPNEYVKKKAPLFHEYRALSECCEFHILAFSYILTQIASSLTQRDITPIISSISFIQKIPWKPIHGNNILLPVTMEVTLIHELNISVTGWDNYF